MSAEKGKSLVQQILAKLPENLRTTVAPAFEAPEAVDALTLLGTAAVDKATADQIAADLAKKEADILTDYNRLHSWYTENKTKLDEYDTLKKGTAPAPPAPAPTPDPAKYMTREDYEKAQLERDQQYAAVLGVTSQISAQHLQRFGEVLDVNAVIANAGTKKLSFADAYADLHKDKITAANQAAEDARINKLVEERLAEARKTQAQPFPLRGGAVEPSPLDQLLQKPEERANRYTADTAAAKYEELVANAGRTH